MKKIFHYTTLLLVLILTASCEDVIDVDVTTAAPKLVIDASINWQKGTIGNEQKIKLTMTTGYFENTIPVVSGATVYITDANNVEYQFVEEFPGTGLYFCHNFQPVLLTDYVLTVIHDGETYTATETLQAVPPIDQIVQRNDGGLTGDEIEIKTFYTDNGATDDYYMIRYKPSFSAIAYLDVQSDEFFQGNQMSDIFFHEDLDHGQHVEITLSGISRTYYNYMTILNNIVGGGGPFQTPPATLRGNIINTTHFDNYALGFFSMSETDYRDYLVE